LAKAVQGAGHAQQNVPATLFAPLAGNIAHCHDNAGQLPLPVSQQGGIQFSAGLGQPPGSKSMQHLLLMQPFNFGHCL
jgi:hypothetical protein